MAGLPIAGGFRFLLTQIVGDWKFFREVFRLDAHYNRDSFVFVSGPTNVQVSCAVGIIIHMQNGLAD